MNAKRRITSLEHSMRRRLALARSSHARAGVIAAIIVADPEASRLAGEYLDACEPGTPGNPGDHARAVALGAAIDDRVSHLVAARDSRERSAA